MDRNFLHAPSQRRAMAEPTELLRGPSCLSLFWAYVLVGRDGSADGSVGHRIPALVAGRRGFNVGPFSSNHPRSVILRMVS